MISISWHLLILIVIIAGLWIITFTRDNDEQYFTSRDLLRALIRVVISLILTIILILIYGGIFWL